MIDEYLEPRQILNLRPDPEEIGYEAELSCGHHIWFAVKPEPTETRVCAECVHQALMLARKPVIP